MYQGNWKCSSCGGAITELPFEPRSEKGLTCRACFMKQKNGEAPQPSNEMASAPEAPDDIPFDAPLAGEPEPAPDFDGAVPVAQGEKPKFEGDWHCATCGSSITSLPFAPRNTENLKCIDCFKESKR